MDPQKLKSFFYGSQYLIGASALVLAYLFFRPKKDTQFKFREVDREKMNSNSPTPSQNSRNLADAKYETKPKPLALDGIRVDAPAHELLKIKENATESEIQKAYRDLMKIYHPDKIGRPGTREWKDAQSIAEAINRARNQMLEKRRSGR